jgi:uncharacterized protein YjiS (DUF1127 family)
MLIRLCFDRRHAKSWRARNNKRQALDQVVGKHGDEELIDVGICRDDHVIRHDLTISGHPSADMPVGLNIF